MNKYIKKEARVSGNNRTKSKMSNAHLTYYVYSIKSMWEYGA